MTRSSIIPDLSADDHKGFRGPLQLPAWAGFQSRQGPYDGLSSTEPSDGTVQLHIIGRHDDTNAHITDGQIAAYQYLLQNQATIRDRMLEALLPEYDSWKPMLGYNAEEAAQYMPDVQDPKEFSQLMGLGIVHIWKTEKNGVAYVGFEFGCTWDDEHGLGILTHQHRIIEIGQVDTSFATIAAERDRVK